jgi:hypothetical protein
MADLITRARALYNLNNLATTSDENTTLDALIAACTKAITKYCRRAFDAQTYDELYDAPDDGRLLVRRFPIISITWLRTDPVAVLYVQATRACWVTPPTANSP